MIFTYNNDINLNGLRFIKIVNNKNKLICIGSKLYMENKNIKKYTLYYYELNENLEIIENSESLLDFKNIEINYLNDLYISLWIRDFYVENNQYFLLIDFNKNLNNISYESNNYLLKTQNFIEFNLIKKYETKNILNKEFNNNLFISKYNNDINNNLKYLFEFTINKIIIKPIFNKYIDYDLDIGHLLHSINYNAIDNCYNVIFSILNYKKEYIIYKCKTNDFINYYDIDELKYITNNINKWYCFPCLFTYFNKNFLIVNQDDFGKKFNPIIFREYDKSLEFIQQKYNINNNIIKNLIFNDNKKYIFLNELINKNGNRYNEIINNNDTDNLNNYSTHSPSCIGLYDVLKYLKINENDSIIDIGSGKGWALTLFNLFPFKKISGIELSLDDIKTCNYNLDLLNINNIELINKDAILFENYNDYNHLFFYNPFNSIIFESIIQKLSNTVDPQRDLILEARRDGSISTNPVSGDDGGWGLRKTPNIKIIYNNIHEDEIKILEKYNFILIHEINGEPRNYFIYQNMNENLKYVMNNNLKIIKNVTDLNVADNLINNIFNLKKNNNLDNYGIKYFENIGISKLQKTKHCYNNYIFNWDKLHLIPGAEIIFNILKNNYENYTNNSVMNDKCKLFPQIIHYPKNGGFLDKHIHTFYPQLIGQVLLLKNTEFTKKGFYFVLDSEYEYDVSNEHMEGDLLIFKFNLIHGVYHNINNNNLEWIDDHWLKDNIKYKPEKDNINGRWVAVLTQI
jgi:hypothetical protein